MTALSSGFTRSTRSIAASTSSRGLTAPERTSSACAVASRWLRSSVTESPSVAGVADHASCPARTSSMTSSDAVERGGAGPLLAEAVHQADGLDPFAGVVEHLPGDRHHGHAEGASEAHDATHHLALEAQRVQEALRGDDEVGSLDALVEVHLVGHQVEPAHQPGARRRQPAGQPSRGAGALHGQDVDAVVGPVHLRQPLQAAAQQLDLRGRRTLLRRERGRRLEERDAGVARDDQVDALQPRRAGGAPAWRPARRRSSPSRRGRR